MKHFTNKVVGQNATIENFPFVVSIWRDIYIPEEAVYKSGGASTGSIISDQWILTAGHVLPAIKDEHTEIFPLVKVQAGSSIRTHGGKIFTVDEIHTYPAYKPYAIPNRPAGKFYSGDFKLIKLKEKILYTDKIAPIMFLGNKVPYTINIGDELTVAGWSKDMPIGVLGEFAYATGKITDIKLTELGPAVYIKHLTDSGDLTTNLEGHRSGDSGTPWFIGMKKDGNFADFRQVGLASGNYQNELFISPAIDPQIYDWILKTTGLREARIESEFSPNLNSGSTLNYSVNVEATPFDGYDNVTAELWNQKIGQTIRFLETSTEEKFVVAHTDIQTLSNEIATNSRYKIKFKFYYGGDYFNSIEKSFIRW